MCETYGRENLDLFTDLFAVGKTLQQVREYSEAFWENYKRIDNYRKYIERIERGELEIAKRQSIDQAIQDKFVQLETKFKEAHPQADIEGFSFKDITIKYDRPVKPADLVDNPFEFD
mmetsp:Transcript_40485/g.61748  ORF Transcript_40485/g.61748 Transcript_40485/m.61748 type:complete len:117 (+) Transcript_40485:3025-3375(+)